MSELLSKLRELNIVVQGNVDLSHGGGSDFYIDVKKALGYPEISDLMRDDIWRLMQRKPTCVAAAGYGGIALATKISDKYRTKLTLVRDKPKDHGLQKMIEGYVPTKEDVVAIVDDVLTTGNSIRKVMDNLIATEAKIIGAYVVVKRSETRMSLPTFNLFKAWELR